MAGEQAESLPEPLREWLTEKADALGTTQSDILARAVAAYRLVDEGGDELDARLESDVENLRERVDDFESRLSDAEDDFDEKLADVRNRVVQVKREADEKAPRDHDHPDLESRVNRVLQHVGELDQSVTDVRNRVDEGFENYEEVLEYLRDETDELDEKTTRLAQAVLETRERVRRLEETRAELLAVREIQRAANRNGETSATCDSCGSRVTIGLLSKPTCPHCEATITDFTPSTGFFGSATLHTGDRPALEAGDAEREATVRLTELFEEETTDE